jgi:LacI family transcriptional regulator
MAKGPSPFRVQIVTDSRLAYFREAVIGARRFGFETGRLEFVDRWLEPELRGDLGRLVRRDRVAGIVAPLHTIAEERRYARLGIPVVNISNALPASTIPVVTQDDVAVGRLAAQHLRLCGARSFGFWGDLRQAYVRERHAGFRDELARHGQEGALWVGSGSDRRMGAWLGRLRRPAGVFAVLDEQALGLMRAARQAGWGVPDEVAVLGAGDDDFWVEFESVPLSSVRLPARRIGYEAAALLADQLETGRRVRGPFRLPVEGVSARRSTDVVFAVDPAVARAVRFIREHALTNPYVEDVARAAGLSRTALQARFRALVGRTILNEIQRTQLVRAQDLLTASDLPIAVIAERCAFPNSQRFSVVFRHRLGVTPSTYRRQHQGRD